MNEVLLLTKDDCGMCEHAKHVLSRLAPEYQINVREVALDSEEGKRLAIEAAVPFPPVVFLDGEPFSYGRLSERKLRKALA